MNKQLLTEPRVREQVRLQGAPSYRARQIIEALYSHVLPEGWRGITVLPRHMRMVWADQFYFPVLDLADVLRGRDGTTRFSFRLADGALVEGVLIPASDRLTACISSQVGCSLDCSFCATGQMKRVRNLTDFEIARQVLVMNAWAWEKMGRRISNVVFMGMGEPLLNYSNVVRAIRALHLRTPYRFGWKRMTLSTSGIARGIRRMADEAVPARLALSLHSAVARKREAIMSIGRANSIESLAEALKYYVAKTGRRVTLEYVLLAGVNDSEEDARALVRFASHFANKVNLIEYNPVPGIPYEASSPDRVARFMELLRLKGVRVMLRHSRGKDIMAACGQLANYSARKEHIHEEEKASRYATDPGRG